MSDKALGLRLHNNDNNYLERRSCRDPTGLYLQHTIAPGFFPQSTHARPPRKPPASPSQVPPLEMGLKRFTVATIALFSSSEQTHCALAVCDTEWATVALQSTFWLCTEMVIRTSLFSCYMADVTWNWCRLGARSVYAILTGTCLQCHFIWSHIRRVRACFMTKLQQINGLFNLMNTEWSWNTSVHP